jgi:maleylpyruvate isomerase
MSRDLDDALRWTAEGTKLCADALAGLDLDHPSRLPGWTRRHLVAHLAANADALGNLVRWAATGTETPMYSSPDQRAHDIAVGALRSPEDLTRWLACASAALGDSMAALTADQWSATVRTAQGRVVPAREIPWLRAREVMVHAVDLDAELSFEDLPSAFLEALVVDVLVKRGPDADVAGPLAGRAAYLTGRADAATAGVSALDGGPAPELGPWL